MKIQLLVDNIGSWIIPYAKKLQSLLLELNHNVELIHSHEDIQKGDVLVLLSCEQILKNLNLNTHNLVIHESALPQGKGWSPLTWQVLEGKSQIPITLFEATQKVDAGLIYEQDSISLNGTELVEELRVFQGEKTIELVIKFITNYPNNSKKKQEGLESFYPKRSPKDSELNIYKTIDEQFNLLRVCDNEKYPAFFYKNGVKYYIKINKAN
ncbi:formyltransferase family protein [Bernardetia sp. Wsw4-3y2]|uniref:formyltransferase family protein n=1 Tax=unclassified Bernardetia TaxID=2647129 RepID=UPI0030CB9C6F